MNDTDVYRETENWKGHKISWSCNGSLESVWLDWPHASRTEVSIQWLQFSNPREYKHVSIHEESQKYVVQTLKELLLALIGLHWCKLTGKETYNKKSTKAYEYLL